VVDAHKVLLDQAAARPCHGQEASHLKLLVVDSASEASGMANAT